MTKQIASVKLKKQYDMFIDGKFVPAVSREYFSTINPATGEKLADIAKGGAADVDLAVKAAQAAFPVWAETSAVVRAAILCGIADAMEANIDVLATIETLDNGKPKGEAIGDISDAIDQFRYFAGCLRASEGSYIPYNKDTFSILIKEPIGVVGQIVPWNFPLNIGSWKLAPALAAGNCIVFKPSSYTSISILAFAEMIKELLPAGVLNIVTGPGDTCGESLICHPGIQKIGFTGSTSIGRRIGAVAGEKIIPATLELGGKSAHIIFPDCQRERALISSCVGILFNSGQVCCAGSRLYVHEDIYDLFIVELKKKFEAVKVGNGLDPETKMGPVINAYQMNKILGYIETGKKEGAHLITGGHRLSGPEYDDGFFIAPTLFADVTNDMTIAREEIFGPVLCVLKFSNEEEVIRLANDSNYGLGGGVWTQDINRALRVAKAVRAGTMWVNEYGPTPSGSAFGGYKDSGYNREVNRQAFEHYVQTKNIYINMNEEPDGSY